MTHPILALDIGGTKIACGVVLDAQTAVLGQSPTPSTAGPEAVLDAAWALAMEVWANFQQTGGPTPAQLAVASAGIIDTVSGRVTSATDAIAGWAGTDLRGGLQRRAQLPTTVLNDVQAHAWGEFVHGQGRGRKSMLLIAAGTGIGGGLVVDGRLVLGNLDAAGHVGHIDAAAADGIQCSCGRSGHVEAVASGTGIERRFAAATGQHLSGGQIAHLGASEEPFADDARLAIHTAGFALGRAIGGMLNVVAPELVALTGSVTRAGEAWWDALRQGVGASALGILAETPVVRGSLENAALVGVAEWGRSQVR